MAKVIDVKFNKLQNQRSIHIAMSVFVIVLIIGIWPLSRIIEDEISKINGLSLTISFPLNKIGNVFALGINSYGQLGKEVISPATKSVALEVNLPQGVYDISAGNDFSLALLKNQTVWSWGKNSRGQLGWGTASDTLQAHPKQISILHHIVSVKAGMINEFTYQSEYSLVLQSDGTVWAWGDNSNGELGNGKESSEVLSTPKRVRAPEGESGALTNIVAIAAGSQFAAALKNDGTVWTWGANHVNETSSIKAVDTLLPSKVNITKVIAIAAGADTMYVLKTDGSVWGWGNNMHKELGKAKNSSQNVNDPIEIKGLKNIKNIFIGSRVVSSIHRYSLPYFVDKSDAAFSFDQSGNVIKLSLKQPIQKVISGELNQEYLIGIDNHLYQSEIGNENSLIDLGRNISDVSVGADHVLFTKS